MKRDFEFEFNQQYLLNDRWLFSVMQATLVDLEGRMPVTVLKPLAVRILAVLARSPGIVLHRQRLFDEGWRAFGFEVCENSLSQAICSLRKTFEMLDAGQAYFKTIPRIGYCLLTNAQPVTAVHSSTSPSVTPIATAIATVTRSSPVQPARWPVPWQPVVAAGTGLDNQPTLRESIPGLL